MLLTIYELSIKCKVNFIDPEKIIDIFFDVLNDDSVNELRSAILLIVECMIKNGEINSDIVCSERITTFLEKQSYNMAYSLKKEMSRLIIRAVPSPLKKLLICII